MIKKDIKGYDITPVGVDDLKEYLRLEGRNLFEEGGIIFGWEGSSFEFRGEFEGEISMDVDIANNFYVDVTHRILFYVEIDGVPNKIGPYTDEPKNIVLCNVKKGFHTIKVIKNTAPIFNKYTLRALRYNGVMAERPEDKKITIEFLGDSISAGSCVTSNEGPVQDLDLDTSADIYYNYAGIVSRHFNANLIDISIHGIGIVNKEGIFCTNGPDIYDYTEYYHDKEQKWDFTSHRSDVVVFALGTNDFAFNGRKEEYYGIASNFLKHVRECNPDSFIYWIYGMMQGQEICGCRVGDLGDVIEKVVNDANDKRLKYIFMPPHDEGGYDHPGVKGHADFARILIEDIENNPEIKF